MKRKVNTLGRTPRKWRRVAALAGLVLGITGTGTALLAFRDYRSGANLLPVLVRVVPAAEDVETLFKVKTISPWKSETTLVFVGDGIWRIPGEEKRLVAEIHVVSGTGTDAGAFEWELCYEPIVTRNEQSCHATWYPCRAELVDGARQTFRLVPPQRKPSLLPACRDLLNWGGDFRLLGWALVRVAYSVVLIIALSLAAIYWRRGILNGMKIVYREFRPTRRELVIGFLILGCFGFLNARHADLATVMFRQFDELSIIRGIEQARFGGRLVYSLPYNILLLPFVLPGILLERFSWAIIGGRMASACWMTFCLHVFVKTMGLFFSRRSVGFMALFLISVPFFWIMGTLVHPDAMMTAMLLACVYFLLKDRLALGISFYIACAFFAAMLASKVHGLMYAPLLPLYAICALRGRRHLSWSSAAVGRGVAVTLCAFILMDLRYASFSFLLRLVNGFRFQMWTNQTGFNVLGTTHVAVTQKLTTIAQLYSPMIVLAVLSALLIAGTILAIKNRCRWFLPLNITLFITAIYHVFFLNKDWSYYYVSVVFLLYTLSLAHLSLIPWLKPPRRMAASVLAILIPQVLLCAPALSVVVRDYYMPPAHVVKLQRETDAAIQKLVGAISEAPRVLIHYNIGFDYTACGIQDGAVRYVVTSMFRDIANNQYPFLDEIDPDVVVLPRREEDWRGRLSMVLIRELEERGFSRIFENALVFVFKRPEHNISVDADRSDPQ